MYFESKNEKKRTLLFISLSFFFLTNAIVAEFMGVKIFSLEKLLGIDIIIFNLLGEKIEGISFTCGVLLWPLVFIMTDIINEYYGRKGVRLLSFLAALMICYSFFMLNAAMKTPPAPWWIFSSNYADKLNFNDAYNGVFGQGLNIIVGSLAAFIIGQFVDVYIFHEIKKRTGNKNIWLRATISTLFSQLIDSFVVLFIAFYVAKMGQPNQWSLSLIFAVGLVNYIYKFIMAFLLSPLIYVAHYYIDRWLGKELSNQMMKRAAGE